MQASFCNHHLRRPCLSFLKRPASRYRFQSREIANTIITPRYFAPPPPTNIIYNTFSPSFLKFFQFHNLHSKTRNPFWKCRKYRYLANLSIVFVFNRCDWWSWYIFFSSFELLFFSFFFFLVYLVQLCTCNFHSKFRYFERGGSDWIFKMSNKYLSRFKPSFCLKCCRIIWKFPRNLEKFRKLIR